MFILDQSFTDLNSLDRKREIFRGTLNFHVTGKDYIFY